MEWILILTMGCVDQIIAYKMSTEPPTAETLVERWATAAEVAKQVDLRFDVRRYDETFNILKVGKGRFYADSTIGSVLISTLPVAGKAADVEDFTTRPCDAEIVIGSTGEVIDIDPTNMTALRFIWPSDEPQPTNPPAGFWNRIGYNPYAYCRSAPRIASGIFLDAELIRNIHNRADLKVTECNGNWVLSGNPNDGTLAPHLSSFKLMFTRAHPFPVAAQMVNSGGTKRTVYIFQKPSINTIPDDAEELLHPNLTGYKIRTIE